VTPPSSWAIVGISFGVCVAGIFALLTVLLFFWPTGAPPLIQEWYFRAGICLIFLVCGLGFHILKRKYPIAYGTGEILLGLAINWISLGKIATLGAPLSERFGFFVGGVYLIKRGIDVIADNVITDEPKGGQTGKMSRPRLGLTKGKFCIIAGRPVNTGP
jgi:hypothetical protein